MRPVPVADARRLFDEIDHVRLLSVGVDIGSSTMHIMFSRVHLKRDTQGLSSEFVLVSTETVWRSEVLLTPYVTGERIDARAVAEFVGYCYDSAGFTADEVDTGAVILTGEALKQLNARAIADAIAEKAGAFVSVLAGHHLEAMLAAHGSGAVAVSEERKKTVLCVDVGGGTTKLTLIRDGEIVRTGAIAVGGRLLSWDGNRRLRHVADACRALMPPGMALAAGDFLSEEDEAALADRAVRDILAVPSGHGARLDPALALTDTDFGLMDAPDLIAFAGGISEYVYGREDYGYGDLGRSIGRRLRGAIDQGRLSAPVVDPGQGIRATVVGASQYSVQVSGSTVAVSEAEVLPLRNVPVVHPRVDLAGDPGAGQIAASVRRALEEHATVDGQTVALAFRFGGLPTYQRLRSLAEGAVTGLPPGGGPVVVLIDKDVGNAIGGILADELGVDRPIVCLDNLQLKPLDFVDIGSMLSPAGVFPVTIKSLLFSGGQG